MPICRAIAPVPIFERAEISLFLDFDGTLVELADRPDAIGAVPLVVTTLTRLSHRLAERVALVSGRSIAQLDALIGPAARQVATVGSHGAEVRPKGMDMPIVERADALVRAQALFEQLFADHAGVVIEAKTFGVAIHYRLAPALEVPAHEAAMRFAAANALEVQKGKMMIEVRVGGHDKGSGIETLMRMAPFAGHMPIFVGDDLTDESGFERCAAMGGAGILVGAARATAATYRLDDVASVHAWLNAL